VKGVLRDLLPPVLWRAMARLRHGARANPAYQGVTTLANLSALHQGRFAQIYDAVYPNDPDLLPDGNLMRLRAYHSFLFAEIASRTPGDFVSVGISFGVTPKVLYELVLKGSNRTYHLIDPLTGKPGVNYCQDAGFVLSQFGGDPLVRLYLTPAPDVFPLSLPDGLAFAEFNTGEEDAELASLPHLIPSLGEGGVILIDSYGWGPWAVRFDDVARAAGASIFCLPTGQGVLVKNR
jgi:hypothetical protein